MSCLQPFAKLKILLLAAMLPSVVSSAIYVDIDVLPSATTTGAVVLERVELAFNDGRSAATVGLNAVLGAQANIRYRGNGPLTGRWLVDGRPLQSFNRTLTFGSQITLNTDALPALPTFEPGVHELTIQFTAPAVNMAMPVLRYTVEAAPGASQLMLLSPLEGATLTRPRRDGLPVSIVRGDAGGDALRFSWRELQLFTTRINRARPSYQFRVLDALNDATALLSAQVSTGEYTLPAALAATLASGRNYRWQVQAFNGNGQLLAASELRSFRLNAPTPIDLRTPAEAANADLPAALSWQSTQNFPNYHVRAYRNDAAMRADITAMVEAARRSGQLTPIANSVHAEFSASVSAHNTTLTQLARATTVPGMQLHWLVMGSNARGEITAFSEAGTFVITPNLTTLNGLPTSLQMAGFEVAIEAYDTGATLQQLSGRGTLRFSRDNAQRAIPINFTGLRAESYREQSRSTTGRGDNQMVVVSETLKGRVTAGQITQNYATPVALNLAGYAVDLRALRLNANQPAHTAQADMVLSLAGYADARGVSPARITLADVALEAGGDFFHTEIGSAATTLTTTQASVAGLSLAGGSLVVDFSRSRDYRGVDGTPVVREAGVFRMGGSARLAASSLFPVTAAQTLQLAFDALELKADGYDGRFAVNGSDVITPVVPAQYQLRFTGGALSIASGQLQTGSLLLSGNVQLPASVQTSSGIEPNANFTELRVRNGVLESEAVNVADIEWGASGGKKFRLVNAGGTLKLPFAVINSSQLTGLTLTRGTLESPLRLMEATPVVDATTLRAPPGGAISSEVFDRTNRLAQSAGLVTELVSLRIGVAGVSGQLSSLANYTGKLGAFDARFNPIEFSFTDNAVTSSRLDGEVIVPKPADFKLAFTHATVTASGDIIGPRVQAPSEISLNYWRVKLQLPATQALLDTLNGTRLAQLDNGMQSDAPLMLALAPGGSRRGELVDEGGSVAGTTGGSSSGSSGVTTGTIGTLPIGTGALTINAASLQNAATITLSDSYLRISRPVLQFQLDARYGPLEFADMQMFFMEIGADGQIRSSQLDRVATRFLKMDFVADSQQALRFQPARGESPAPGDPLVVLDGTLSFPHLGARHVTLSHTASGARADNITPNAGGAGNEDFLRFEATDLVFHNGYAEGKGNYKEFLGKSQLKVLKTLYLGGLTMVGADDQGVYERAGLGIGVDPVKAASLYAGGAIPVASKLGAGAVNLATGGRSTAETEVAQLVGSAAELATEATPDKRAEKLVKTLADSITLARRIHKDSGGRDEDDAGTALAITSVVLNGAVTFTKDKDRSNKRLVVAVADALDVSLGILVKSRPNGQAMPNDARNAIELARLAVKAARAGIDDGKFTQSEWLGIADQLLVASKGFSTDRNYQFMIALLAGTVEVARASDKLDDAATLRIASRAFRTLRESGLIAGNDANNVLLIAQALIDGMGVARDMPIPNNAVSLGRHVLDVAAGPDTNFGSNDVTVKGYFKLANRTLELAGIAGGGIRYADAGRAVQTTLHASAGATDVPYVAVDNLVSNWVLMDSRPLATTITELQSLIVCEGQSECSFSDMSTLVSSAVAAATSALNATDFHAALARIKAIRNAAKSANTEDDYNLAFNDARKTSINTKAQQILDNITQQMHAATARHEVTKLTSLALTIERLLTVDLNLPGNNMVAFSTELETRMVGFMQQLVAEINRAQSPAEVAYPTTVLLGIARQRELLSLTSLPGGDAALTAVANQLARFRSQYEQAVTAARTFDQLKAAVQNLLTLERQAQILGSSAASNFATPIANALDRANVMLQTELNNALQVGRYGLQPVYERARNSLSMASRIEDADDAVAIIKLFGTAGVPAGYTSAQVVTQRNALMNLLQQKAAMLYADALARMRSGDHMDMYPLASRYFAIEELVQLGRTMFNHQVVEWIAKSETVSCSEWRSLHERLRNPAMRFASDQASIRSALVDMYARCLDTPETTTAGVNPSTQYTAARGAAFEDLSTYLSDLAIRRSSGQPEAFLKEELAWKLADRIKTLTAFFVKNPADNTQRTLGRVHHQTDYLLRYRQASTPDRVIAALKLLSEPLLEHPEVDPLLKREVQYLVSGLTEFATLGGAQKKGVDQGIDLAAGLVGARFAEGSVEKSLVSLVRQALYEARKPLPNGNTNSNAPAVIGVIALVGAGAAVVDQAVGGFRLPPAVLPTLELFTMLGDLSTASGKAEPGAQLDMAMAFLDKAAKLPAVDRYVKPLINPVAHLAAPDTNQNDYLANLLLAELVVARHDNKANTGKAFKSSCPGFSFEQGVQLSAPLNGNDVFVCAIDLARESIVNNMLGAMDPTSPAGQAQNARVVIGGMRRETVFARTTGDETLSGISGLLEYRNGNLNRFDFLATFGLAGQFETASQVSWNGSSQILRIEQASLDGRDSGLLASLGLSRAGSNRLFGTDYFNNPIKYLQAEIGSPAACINMAADFGLTTPMGNWNTGRQNLATCFNPFTFDMSLNTRGNLYVVIGTEGRMQLFFGNGTGGLKVGTTIGLYPTAFGFGAFVDGKVDLGMGAGAAGLEICGEVAARVGATAPGKLSDCPNNFVPDNASNPAGPGVCRHPASLGADVRVGTNYQNFFVKGQGGLDMQLVYLGGWFYISPTLDGGLLSRFPADRHGGFTGATQLSCGSL